MGVLLYWGGEGGKGRGGRKGEGRAGIVLLSNFKAEVVAGWKEIQFLSFLIFW